MGIGTYLLIVLIISLVGGIIGGIYNQKTQEEKKEREGRITLDRFLKVRKEWTCTDVVVGINNSYQIIYDGRMNILVYTDKRESRDRLIFFDDLRWIRLYTNMGEKWGPLDDPEPGKISKEILTNHKDPITCISVEFEFFNEEEDPTFFIHCFDATRESGFKHPGVTRLNSKLGLKMQQGAYDALKIAELVWKGWKRRGEIDSSDNDEGGDNDITGPVPPKPVMEKEKVLNYCQN